MNFKSKKNETKDNPTTLKGGTTIPECIRCGTCCKKGGPCFHIEDRMLIEKGKIPATFLYTIRKGELARDNVRGCLKPVDSDVVKIKSKIDSWACILFDAVKKTCTLYDDRPLECRVLNCRDTRGLERIYADDRLTRADLVSKVKGLWDLINDHQARCDYKNIQPLIHNLAGSRRQNARRKLLEIIRYDAEIRKLVVARGGLDPEMLDFLFGRPLTNTLKNCGIRIHQKGKKNQLDGR